MSKDLRVFEIYFCLKHSLRKYKVNLNLYRLMSAWKSAGLTTEGLDRSPSFPPAIPMVSILRFGKSAK